MMVVEGSSGDVSCRCFGGEGVKGFFCKGGGGGGGGGMVFVVLVSVILLWFCFVFEFCKVHWVGFVPFHLIDSVERVRTYE